MPVSSTVLVAPDSSEVFLPSEHIKDVGQSLPELAGELVAARCAQHTEVEHKEELLQELKVVLSQYQTYMGLVWKNV